MAVGKQLFAIKQELSLNRTVLALHRREKINRLITSAKVKSTQNAGVREFKVLNLHCERVRFALKSTKWKFDWISRNYCLHLSKATLDFTVLSVLTGLGCHDSQKRQENPGKTFLEEVWCLGAHFHKPRMKNSKLLEGRLKYQQKLHSRRVEAVYPNFLKSTA